ncbi:hypothetical protein MHB42_01560 [Lysinibacillus sp. FSL K6-0232]|uniref:hypothetical protein n=1 Tax=unclassified Lysinibacillus TaxID=2636778 RepID=UPI0030FC0364
MLNEHIPNIPWQQLTTAYGRGTTIPQLIEQEQYQQLATLIEHQGTLWQATPWTLLIPLKRLTGKNKEDVTLQEIELYLSVASVITKDSLNPANTVSTMQELLNTQYLWSEEDDELEWDKDLPKGYEQQAFLGYYYFSYLLLQEATPIFTAIATTDNREVADSLAELLALLKQQSSWGA